MNEMTVTTTAAKASLRKEQRDRAGTMDINHLGKGLVNLYNVINSH